MINDELLKKAIDDAQEMFSEYTALEGGLDDTKSKMRDSFDGSIPQDIQEGLVACGQALENLKDSKAFLGATVDCIRIYLTSIE